MLTDKEVKIMALTDALRGLDTIRELVKVLGFGYEIDDAICELRDVFEFEYDEINQ